MTWRQTWLRHPWSLQMSLALIVVEVALGAGWSQRAIAAQSAEPDAAERLRAGESRMTQLRAVYDRLALAVASIPDAPPADDMRADASVDRLTVQLEALQRALTATGPSALLSEAELERRVADAERQRATLLQDQVTAASARPGGSDRKGLNEDAPLRGLRPVEIKLVKNRVVPMESPFYTARRAKLRTARPGETVDGVVVSRVQDGETAGDAIRPDGLLDVRLRKSDPAQHYFLLSVSADSIAAFRVVAAELTRRGFAYSWDTGNDEQIVVTEAQLRNGSGNAKVAEGMLPPRK